MSLTLEQTSRNNDPNLKIVNMKNERDSLKGEVEDGSEESLKDFEEDINRRSIDSNQYTYKEDTTPEVPEIKGLRLFLLFFGLCLSVFLASLDTTIVSTALPKITSEFNALNQITWVAASYLLTCTAFQPLYGKLSDIFGRKPAVLFGLITFLVGSLLCGLSSTITMLIVARAITGIGAGGLMIMTIIVISDIIKIERRASYISIVSAIFAMASVVGPVLGGALTDNVGWRWVFYINLPIGAVTLITVLLFLSLKPIKFNVQLVKTVDYFGILFLVSFCSLLVTGLTWGGSEYPWNSVQVISVLATSLVCLILFVVVEFKYSFDPIIPARLLSRNMVSACINSFFVGCSFFISIYYIPIYFQVIKGKSATIAGLELLPFLLGVVFGCMSSGVFTNLTGKYRQFNFFGGIVSIVGVCLLAFRLRSDISRVEEIAYPLVLGLGLGMCIQNNTIIAQACVADKDTALASSFVNFMLTLGGVVALAIQGALFKDELTTKLIQFFPDVADITQFTSSFEFIKGLQPVQIAMVLDSYLMAIKYIYFTMIPYCVVAFLASWTLKHIPLDGRSLQGMAH